MGPNEGPKGEAKTLPRAASPALREQTVRVVERVERTVVERVMSPFVAAQTSPDPARRPAQDEARGAQPGPVDRGPKVAAAGPREPTEGAPKQPVDRPTAEGRESYAARLQRAEEELRERRLAATAKGPPEAPGRPAEAPAKGPTPMPVPAPLKAAPEPRVRDKAAPAVRAREPEGQRMKPASAAKTAPQPTVTPRAERRPTPAAAPKPATPSIKISIGRVEIQTKGAPQVAEPSVVWPRAHGIDPGLPFGSTIPGRF